MSSVRRLLSSGISSGDISPTISSSLLNPSEPDIWRPWSLGTMSLYQCVVQGLLSLSIGPSACVPEYWSCVSGGDGGEGVLVSKVVSGAGSMRTRPAISLGDIDIIHQERCEGRGNLYSIMFHTYTATLSSAKFCKATLSRYSIHRQRMLHVHHSFMWLFIQKYFNS